MDFDLALLYQVETKALNQAVKRNISRFPKDFMFRLTFSEWNSIKSQIVHDLPNPNMRSQIVTASQTRRNTEVTPYAFTEQGIAMLSGVLNSPNAINL